MTTINNLTTEQTTMLTDDSFVIQTAAGVTKKIKATNTKLIGYEDILFVPTEAPNGSTGPSLTTFRGNIKLGAFTGTGSTVQELFGALHIPHNYVAGTDIYLHIHWSHIIASPTGNVNWKMDYSIARGFGFEAFPAPTTIDLTQAAGAQYNHHIIESTAITGTNIEVDTLVLLRIYRDPADVLDTFANDAYFLRADAHIQVDNRATKEKTRPFTKV
jgi:hypothetical protein